MTKFRSLIFRELKICRKWYIIGFLSLLAFSAFVILITFFLTNLFDGLPENIGKSLTQMFCMLAVLYSTVIFSNSNAFKSDLNSGWLGYSYALPLTASERAAVKLICFIGTQAISMLLGIACAFIINSVAGAQFQIGYVVLQLIILDILLLYKIISDFFVLRARNTDEYKKLQDKGGLIFLVVVIIIALITMKCVGFDFGALLKQDSSEPLPLDIISMLTGEMLFWIIPLTLVLLALHFAVINHHLQYAFPGGAKIKRAKVKAEASVNLTAPHSEPVGFLYKEIKQNSKSILAVILLPFIILVFLTLCLAIVSLSEKYGGDNWILGMLTSDAIRLASIAIGFFSVSGLLMSVFHGDDKKLWAYFTACLPTGVNKFLYTKYVLSFAMCGLYFVSCYVAETLIATISWFALGKEIMSFTGIFIIIFFMLILQNSFSIPTTLRYGEKKGNIINLIVILSIAIAAILALALIPREIQDMVFAWLAGFLTGDHGDLTALLLGLFPACSVGAYILSYKVSCKIFMKGVNEYDK
ncbi:MAG: ABC-2 transporter permease [Ruminiclostridium sp.]